jgi:hypothetical protein
MSRNGARNLVKVQQKYSFTILLNFSYEIPQIRRVQPTGSLVENKHSLDEEEKLPFDDKTYIHTWINTIGTVEYTNTN